MPKINNIALDDTPYAQITSGIANIPKKLWLMGNLPQHRRVTVAIVGTRKPTTYGRETTYRLSYELAKRGLVIISGLALGVDGIAHQAALDAGGTTIAILPTSVESIYPRAHQQLARRIVDSGGALLSEYSSTDGVFKTNFVARNRIVTALSDGLLITEAAARSGTLTTANFALEQGKPVMAVPGNITSLASAGCNNLLKVGATPITEVADVLLELGLADLGEQTRLPLPESAEESKIIKLLKSGVRSGEELQKQSNLPPALFSQTLTMMEISGKIRALGANNWAIR
jgi:DNA processing protein